MNWFTLLPSLLGGIGLFLLGMILLSDGLKAAAGGALEQILESKLGQGRTVTLQLPALAQ